MSMEIASLLGRKARCIVASVSGLATNSNHNLAAKKHIGIILNRYVMLSISCYVYQYMVTIYINLACLLTIIDVLLPDFLDDWFISMNLILW